MSNTTEINESQSSNAIRAVRERFNEAIANHDAESIGALLAPEYHIVTGRSDQFHGAEEEPLRWSDVFEKDPAVVYRRTLREIRVNENWGLAEELGNWTGRYSAANGMGYMRKMAACREWQVADSA